MDTLHFNLDSLYICVHDMNRAIQFYETLLGQPVNEKDELYSVFDIEGFRFGLFAFGKTNEAHIFGNNCLPSLRVDNWHSFKQRLEALHCPIVFAPTAIGCNLVLEFVDSEGNHIEATSPIKQPDGGKDINL